MYDESKIRLIWMRTQLLMNSYSHIYLTPIIWSKHNYDITRIGKNKLVKTKASDYVVYTALEAHLKHRERDGIRAGVSMFS